MVILKKIKSSTLVEVIVASALIVIVFMIASLILNNLLINDVSKKTHSVENRLNELEYEIRNGLIRLPYEENYKNWDISIRIEVIEKKKTLVLYASINGHLKINRQRVYEQP